ncbi:hypothetical protein I0C86_41910 [Plantactinospora sp. S1510]|uniref:DUF1648 domain-containing protein n=1 Tax=Plantactinospora alkalitolerans TaxID=2789879 RepID=A0ABS0HAA6_9ACTN|nr:hypothetical protein [Plantactinospora alkalitolerans]MBF9135410.1 hypothetical protein [Plantactinospora alkalitolerans]
MRTVRWIAGIGLLPGALLGGATALTLAWRERLPDRLPNQGGVGDRPVMTTIPVDTLTAILIGVALAAWITGLVVFLAAGRLPRIPRHWLRAGVQVAVATVASAAVTILLMVLGAALDATTAADVNISWGYFAATMAVPAVVAAGSGLVAILLAGRAPERPSDPTATTVSAAAPQRAQPTSAVDDERLLWWESRSLRPVVWAMVALALSGLLLAAVLVPLVGVPGWAGLAPTVTAPVLLPFTRYRLAIDARGVRLTFGLVRWRLPLTAIAAAEETSLDAATWLTRGMLRGATDRTLPLLPGPVLALRLTDGTCRLVTCRDVGTAVNAVNALRARATAR